VKLSPLALLGSFVAVVSMCLAVVAPIVARARLEASMAPTESVAPRATFGAARRFHVRRMRAALVAALVAAGVAVAYAAWERSQRSSMVSMVCLSIDGDVRLCVSGDNENQIAEEANQIAEEAYRLWAKRLVEGYPDGWTRYTRGADGVLRPISE
jgi:hypothetical protein